MRERFNRHAWKACVAATLPRVRIPPSPQSFAKASELHAFLKMGSGKAFAYKRLIAEALRKDFDNGRIPKVLRS